MRSLYLFATLIAVVSIQGQADSTLTLGPDSLDLMGIQNLTLSASELEDQTDDQAVSGLLQSNQDVFMRNAGFNFSAGRFRIRGMNSNNGQVLLNGVVMNDPELGFPIWANWGGLNDITRYPETGVGVSASEYSFGGVTGFSNVDLRASTKRSGTRFSYSASNRTYRNRAMLTHNTGVMDNGISISASMSARWAEEGYVEGTSYSNMSYFLSIEKKLNDRTSVGVLGLGSPSLRGRSSLSTLEAYDLRNDNYYNPYWGYQAGEKRNSRMRGSHKPIVMAWHRTKPNENMEVKTSLYGQFGSYYQTRLDWVDANDPRPDYYRNLPSYLEYTQDLEGISDLQSQWANDESFYQLDWDSFYNVNSRNLHSVQDANGVDGNVRTGLRSKYILEEAHSDPLLVGVNSTVNIAVDENSTLVLGLNASGYQSDNYKVVNDFLGGEYWLDINRFADGIIPGAQGAQNDLDNPNKIVTEDVRYGYDYTMNKRNLEVFGQYREELDKVDYYIGFGFNDQVFWRDGQFRNELFADNSKGESEHQHFVTGGVKAGLNYKVTGRHFVSVNVANMSRAPLIRNSFLSPRTRNTIVPDLTTEKVSSMDLSYQVRFPNFKMRLTGYSAAIKDQVNSFTFYSGDSNDLIQLVTSGIDQSYTGLELGVDAKATSTISVNGAFATGRHIYTSRPNVTRVIDETDTPQPTERAYLKNFRVGRTPQTAVNLGFTYRDPHFWFTGLNYSYFTDIFVDPLSSRRTVSASDGLVENDPQYDDLLGQTELDGAGVLNFFAGKSWRFDRKYYLLVTANVSNVLDKTDFVTGGYEQGRPSTSQLELFDNKYAYMYGRTFFAMVRFSF